MRHVILCRLYYENASVAKAHNGIIPGHEPCNHHLLSVTSGALGSLAEHRDMCQANCCDASLRGGWEGHAIMLHCNNVEGDEQYTLSELRIVTFCFSWSLTNSLFLMVRLPTLMATTISVFSLTWFLGYSSRC